MSILDYIRKVNGIDKNKNLKQNEIDDMVDDYEHGKNMLITRFSVMINTSDALDVYINDSDTPIKAIIDEKRKYSSTNNAEETIQVYPQLIKSGDYVSFKKFYEPELNKYLIVSEIKSNRDNYEGIILKCNQKLKWKDKNGVHEYACYCKNDSYGVKDSYSGSKLEVSETKLKIYVQFNDETESIKENMRFMFNNREQDIYKVITASTVTNENLLILTCKNDNYRPQDDDLENNLAYNELEKEQEEKPTEPTNPKPIQSYEIIGMDSVKHKNNYTYTLNPINLNCVWKLDEIDIGCTADIVNQTHDSVTVYAIETLSTDWFTLYAKDGDTILAKKKVIIKSK